MVTSEEGDSAGVQDMGEECQLAGRGFFSWLGHKFLVFPEVLLLSHKDEFWRKKWLII